MQANVSEHKANTSHIHGRLVKCPEQIFHHLFLYSKYHHMSALQKVTYLVCNILCTQCNRHSARMYLLHMCDIADLLTIPHYLLTHQHITIADISNAIYFSGTFIL